MYRRLYADLDRLRGGSARDRCWGSAGTDSATPDCNVGDAEALQLCMRGLKRTPTNSPE